jgi:hypothetical protein
MRFHFLRRHNEPHDRSAAFAPQYLQGASHQLRALSHSNQPDALVSRVWRESFAVIFNFQAYRMVLKFQPHPGLLRSRMALYII